jgi:Zn finger protein HypA/HybF involved in hydrogenase expression
MACLNCGNLYTLENELIPCPKCASDRVKIIAGNDFRVDSIEITK